MVHKLKRMMGRVDVRVLVLLTAGILMGSLAWATVQLSGEQAEDSDARTLNTWRDLIKEFADFRDTSYPLVIPALLSDASPMDWAALQMNDWFWDFEAGTYYFDPGSEISKQIPHDTDLMVYEDIAQKELLVLSVPKTAGAPYKEEMVFRATAWPQPSRFERHQRYLDRELCKRRIVWHITLKSRRVAERETALAASQPAMALTDSGGSMQTMSMEALEELKITHIKKVTNSLQLEISYPSSYSGSVWSAYSYDMPACVYTNGGSGSGGGFEPPTNEAPCEGCSTCYTDPEKSFAGLDRVWTLAVSNLVLTGEASTVWLDARPLGLNTNNEPCHRIYAIGANAVDEDNDGLNSAVELFVHKTNPTLSDADLDGALDGAEIRAGTNPLNHPGDSDEDGLSDDLETVLGTDPDSADTDLDWFSDGFEEAKRLRSS